MPAAIARTQQALHLLVQNAVTFFSHGDKEILNRGPVKVVILATALSEFPSSNADSTASSLSCLRMFISGSFPNPLTAILKSGF